MNSTIATLVIETLVALASGSGVVKLVDLIAEQVDSWHRLTTLQKRLLVTALAAVMPCVAFSALLALGKAQADTESLLSVFGACVLSYMQSQYAHAWVKDRRDAALKAETESKLAEIAHL